MEKSVLELHGLDVLGFIRVLEKCKGSMFLVTREGDRLNLRSKPSQLMGLTHLIEGGKITEAFSECDDPGDESILSRYNLFQEP